MQAVLGRGNRITGLSFAGWISMPRSVGYIVRAFAEATGISTDSDPSSRHTATRVQSGARIPSSTGASWFVTSGIPSGSKGTDANGRKMSGFPENLPQVPRRKFL